VQLVGFHLAAERVAVHAQQASRTRLIAPRVCHHLTDVFLFEFPQGSREWDSPVYQLPD
jgi:hypothetical protein